MMNREDIRGISPLWGLLALAVAVLSTGCSDWPHFSYSPSPLMEVDEVEAEAGEPVQNLSRLHGDVLVFGQIASSVYVPESQHDAPFDLPGWYGGDMDWFQFNLRDPEDSHLLLSWTRDEDALDLYFFSASPDTGELSLFDYLDEVGGTQQEMGVPGLVPGIIYVVAVAGHSGTAVDYELLLEFSP